MTLKYSTTVRNAKMNAIEADIGASPILELRTGAPPANCAAARTGTLLLQQAIPADWLAAAAAGAVAGAGLPWALAALAGISTADIGYFSIMRAGSPSQCDMQGEVTATGGGGVMTVNNISLAALQAVSVTAFTLTDNNG